MAKPSKPGSTEVLDGLKGHWRGSAEALRKCWDSCLDEMLMLFYPPFRASDDDEMLVMSIKAVHAYAEDLAGYSEEQLRKAWRQVRREHKVERWPTINAILDAIGTDNRGARSPGGRRPANDAELEYQRTAYGSVYMSLVTDDDVHHHRRQAEARRQGVRGGYNPFAGKAA